MKQLRVCQAQILADYQNIFVIAIVPIMVVVADKMKSDLKREFMFEEKELRKIINSWNLISGSPADEFDALNHMLLGHLGRESGEEKIEKVIHSELIVRYGLDVNKTEAKKFATQILDWWTNRN